MSESFTPLPQRLLVSAREAARLLSVSERTLWTLSNNGRVPRLKVGRAVRYAVSDLESFIETAKEGGADEQ